MSLIDPETYELKQHVSNMDDDDLLKMVANHSEYRQVTLDFATEELTRRHVPFVPPPPKPIRIVWRRRPAWIVIRLAAGLLVLTIIGTGLYRALTSPETVNPNQLINWVFIAVVVVVTLFLMLTTNESNQ